MCPSRVSLLPPVTDLLFRHIRQRMGHIRIDSGCVRASFSSRWQPTRLRHCVPLGTIFMGDEHILSPHA